MVASNKCWRVYAATQELLGVTSVRVELILCDIQGHPFEVYSVSSNFPGLSSWHLAAILEYVESPEDVVMQFGTKPYQL
ncbi:hypothetical protein SLEP1_g35520 [Rubroshorea leprosula]|uniref:Uncharacterized protein n=1 Tax=Rubroshorea leprosula TaxID=152421 RepID=A0AAV5KNQ1_9ROSI|nr:hypothetical protein SLEP1_g35520 [Rubroshorea leprosula]